jgi:hypothetical protein
MGTKPFLTPSSEPDNLRMVVADLEQAHSAALDAMAALMAISALSSSHRSQTRNASPLMSCDFYSCSRCQPSASQQLAG